MEDLWQVRRRPSLPWTQGRRGRPLEYELYGHQVDLQFPFDKYYFKYTVVSFLRPKLSYPSSSARPGPPRRRITP
jgi:hypothetical protein